MEGAWRNERPMLYRPRLQPVHINLSTGDTYTTPPSRPTDGSSSRDSPTILYTRFGVYSKRQFSRCFKRFRIKLGIFLAASPLAFGTDSRHADLFFIFRSWPTLLGLGALLLTHHRWGCLHHKSDLYFPLILKLRRVAYPHSNPFFTRHLKLTSKCCNVLPV